MKEKNKVTPMSYCNITPFLTQRTQYSTVIKDMILRIDVVNVSPPAKVQVQFLHAFVQVMVIVGVTVAGVHDVFKLL